MDVGSKDGKILVRRFLCSGNSCSDLSDRKVDCPDHPGSNPTDVVVSQRRRGRTHSSRHGALRTYGKHPPAGPI